MASPDHERPCDFWGQGAHGEQDPQGPVLQREGGGQRDPLLRGAERYRGLGRDPGTQASAHRRDAAALLTTQLRGRENTEREDPTQHTSQAGGTSEWRIPAEPPVREQRAQVWKAGAECLRFAPVSQSLSQTGEPNTHLLYYRLHRVARSGSGVSC